MYPFHFFFISVPGAPFSHLYIFAIGVQNRMEESRSAFKILTGKPTGKRPVGRPRR